MEGAGVVSMSSWRFSEVTVSSRRSGSRVVASRVQVGPELDEEGRVELREAERGAETSANTILLPVAVAAVFLVVLVLGAIVG